MGEFFGHLKDTKWLEWKGWFCACCCPGYVFGKVAYDKIQDDSYRLPYVCCPCVGAFWYMKAVERLPDPCLNRILAYFWMALCPLCAVYVAAVEDGIDPSAEFSAWFSLMKKVICIDRS